jgi:hypothetical protein
MTIKLHYTKAKNSLSKQRLEEIATISENIGREQLSERSEFCDRRCFQLKGAYISSCCEKVIFGYVITHLKFNIPK